VSTRIALLLFCVVMTSVSATARAEDPRPLTCCGLDDDHHRCVHDSTDVVGYRDCPPYGSWGNTLLDPYVFVDIGMNMRYFATAADPPAVSLRTTAHPTSASHGARALTFDERIGFGLSRGLYTAIDFELGDFSGRNDEATESDLVVAGLASFGARLWLGPVSLSGELAAGAMETSFPAQTDVHVQGVVEGRGRVDLWLTPWFTINGVLGTSLIDRGDWMAGLYIGLHSWAFAGDRW
jgi:hypothetical protein